MLPAMPTAEAVGFHGQTGLARRNNLRLYRYLQWQDSL